MLKANKAFTKKFFKYLELYQCFLFNLGMNLSKNIKINNYYIKLVKDKQVFYKLIYSLGQIKSEILNIYIKIFLKTRYI